VRVVFCGMLGVFLSVAVYLSEWNWMGIAGLHNRVDRPTLYRMDSGRARHCAIVKVKKEAA